MSEIYGSRNFSDLVHTQKFIPAKEFCGNKFSRIGQNGTFREHLIWQILQSLSIFISEIIHIEVIQFLVPNIIMYLSFYKDNI